MESALSDERQKEIREALSEAFVDNEVDYAFLARGVAGVPLGELENIFFTEVAPHCGPNLMSAIPPVWAGFDRERLALGIRAMQARAARSTWGRLRHRLAVAFCRRRFGRLWDEIEAEVCNRRADSPAS